MNRRQSNSTHLSCSTFWVHIELSMQHWIRWRYVPPPPPPPSRTPSIVDSLQVHLIEHKQCDNSNLIHRTITKILTDMSSHFFRINYFYSMSAKDFFSLDFKGESWFWETKNLNSNFAWRWRPYICKRIRNLKEKLALTSHVKVVCDDRFFNWLLFKIPFCCGINCKFS